MHDILQYTHDTTSAQDQIVWSTLLYNKVIIGLGNPGAQYDGSPHNLGFMFIDAILQRYHHVSHHLQHQTCYIVDELQSIIIKPNTYMNLSGFALREVYNKFFKNKNPHEFIRSVIVAHDDTSLNMFDIKVKDGLIHNGSGGHNGIRHLVNIAKEIKCNDRYCTGFMRIRLGCKPKHECQLQDYVCKKMHNDHIVEWKCIFNNIEVE